MAIAIVEDGKSRSPAADTIAATQRTRRASGHPRGDGARPPVHPRPATVEALIASVYEAALAPDPWSAISARIADVFGADHATLAANGVAGDGPPDAMFLTVTRSGGRALVLTLGAFADPTAGTASRPLLEAIGSHLLRAVEIADRQGERELESMTMALEHAGIAAAILDGRGREVVANERFASRVALSERGAGRSSMLRCRRGGDGLDSALRRLSAGTADAAVPLHDATGGCAAALHLLPLDRPTDRALALALVAEPGTAPGLSAEFVRWVFGLTPAEAQIACAVAEGLAVPTIARRAAASVETVRSHLKRIYSKTGTSRQIELALLVRGFRRPADPRPSA